MIHWTSCRWQTTHFLASWLPFRLPSNVKIIVSTLPEKYGILDTLKQKLQDESCFCEIPALSYDTANAIIERYLLQKRRTLTQHQRQLLLSAFSRSPGPLFLKLLLDEAIKWKSYTQENQIDLAESVQVAISTLFRRLESKFGQVVSSHALGYITVGLNGLSEIEIEDALSCDDEALNDVYRYHNPPVDGIVRIPSVLWARIRFEIREYLVERLSEGKHTLNWYHRQFIETARSMYATGQQAEKLHTVLAETFIADNGVKRDITLSRRKITIQNADRQVTPKPLIPENVRKLRCLPYHLINAGNNIDGYLIKDSCFCNLNFISSKLSAFSTSSFLEDINGLLNQKDDDEVWLIQQFFMVCKADLSQPPKLAFNLLSYINAGPEQISLIKLLKKVHEYLVSSNKPSLMPLYPGFTPHQNTESALEASFLDCSEILSYSSDMILFRQDSRQTGEDTETLTLYNINTKDLHTLSLSDSEKRINEFHFDGSRVIYTSATDINIFDIETSTTSKVSFKNILKTHTSPISGLTTLSSDAEHFVIVFEDCNVLVFETASMTKINQFSCGELVKDIIGIVCTSIDKLGVIVLGQKETRDSNRQSGFIKLFYQDHSKEQKCKSISDSFAKGLFYLSGSDDAIVGAVNNRNKSKIISTNLESFEEKCLANVGSQIVQLAGSKTEDLTVALTEEGSFYIIKNGDVIKTGFDTDNAINCFGPYWEQNNLFLGDCQGNVLQHDMLTSKNNKIIKTQPGRILKTILPFKDQLVILDKNKEMGVWSLPTTISDSSKTSKLSKNNIANEILTYEVCCLDVNGHSLVMACKDNIVRLWSLQEMRLQKQFDFGIIPEKCHFADDTFIFGLARSTGIIKMVNMVDGSFIFGDLKITCLDFTISKDLKTVYVLSRGPSGDLNVLVLSPRLGVVKKQFSLKQTLAFVKIDISVNLNERYLILRLKCTENEISAIKGTSKARANLRHQYKFSAVDLEQGNGAVTTCYRYMTKTPLLGEVTEPYQNNSMMVASGRTVLFWDIPTGKCINRVHKAQKKDMMSRSWWIEGDCKGTSFAIAQSRDGNVVGVGSEDGYFIIYNANTGMPVGNCLPTSKHNAAVVNVVCSPDSKWFVSACENHVIKLWDSKSAVEVFSFRVDADIQQIKFSMNSKYLVVLKGSKVLMYKLNPGK
ncbi:hypothetical protein KUTeg_003823 [Tegillarca granosa]|uniref:NWD1/2-like winged helix-turn-helix domain-containing protein n=1 Tax=Tegillarca granosa TaxID=220873 RepID=A0ABQ9FS06_TEGGR|nr:hypothetical protein KUTeg_003823 [Tegillarca granosa]